MKPFVYLCVSLFFIGLAACQDSPCNAIPIYVETGSNVTEYGSNVNLPYYAESSCNRGEAGTAWFSINPPSGSNVIVTTCGEYTDFDTVIGIYTGSCSNPSCLVANDDEECSSLFYYESSSGEYWWDWWFFEFDDDDFDETSTVTFTSNGSNYYIGVTGYEEEGNFELSISVSDPNDSGCMRAKDIPGDYYTPVSINGTLTDSDRVGMSVCNALDFDDYGSWFIIHPQPNQYMNITTCSSYTDFDTRLAIVAGTDCTNVDCIDENDDDYCDITTGYEASTITFLPTLSEYYVVVASYDDDIDFLFGYNYILTISQSTLTENTPCINAYPLHIGVTGNPEGSTAFGSTLSSAVCSNEYGNAIWYEVSASSYTNVQFTTCNSVTNFDTMLSVYSGSCEALSCLTYNDDDGSCSNSSTLSTVQVSLSANEVVYLVISGYNGATGTYRIDYSTY